MRIDGQTHVRSPASLKGCIQSSAAKPRKKSAASDALNNPHSIPARRRLTDFQNISFIGPSTHDTWFPCMPVRALACAAEAVLPCFRHLALQTKDSACILRYTMHSIGDEQAPPGLPVHCTCNVSASRHIFDGEYLTGTNHATFAVAHRHFHVRVQAHDQLSFWCIVPREVVICRRLAKKQTSFGGEWIRQCADGTSGFQRNLLHASCTCCQL